MTKSILCESSAGLAVLAMILLFISAGISRAGPAETGELRIEGQGIKQLILQDEKGRTRAFDSPGSAVTLSPGEYTIHTIRLEGDHYVQSHLIPAQLRVTAEPNAPATLRIGAPLRHVVKVERQGPTMVLAYELIGQGGEPYVLSRNRPEQRPAFTVYRGDRKVASGDFEFG
jgi:hypothetical protein